MAKFTNRLLMAGVASVTLVIAATQAAPAWADQQETATYSQVGAWQIRVDTTLGNSCYMTTTYKDGSLVRFSYNNQNNGAFVLIQNPAWASLVNGNTYQLTLQVDSGPASPVTAKAIIGNGSGFPGLIMGFRDPESFMPVFGLTNQMRLSYQGREIGRYNLVGTAQAITAMTQCNVAYGGPNLAAKQPTDPFRQTGPVRQVDPFKTL